jgi:hypothetical protein
MSILRTLRPRFRFSLRLAAVVVTAFCVWFGLVTSRARRQERAVDELARLGVTVRYDANPDELWAPKWLRDLLGDHYFLSVTEAQLHHRMEGRQGRAMTPMEIDNIVTAMRDLPRLHYLYFAFTGIGDDGIECFAPLANQIDELYLAEPHGAELTGNVLAHVAIWPKLTSLGIPYGIKEVDNLSHLVEFPSLTTLRLGNVSLDGKAFAAIAKCRHLETLSLYMCHFEGVDLGRLRHAPALRVIHFHNTSPEFYGDPANLPPGVNAAQIRIEPEREFHFVPDSGMAPAPLGPSTFPEKRYDEWLNETLPGVETSSMSTGS